MMRPQEACVAHILIVDDDPNLVDTLRVLFESADHRVSAVDRGEETFAVIESDHPDLVILDMFLPEMHGLDVYSQLRELPRAGEMAVLVLTGAVEYEASLEEIGVRYLFKPVRHAELTAVVNELLAALPKGVSS